MSGSAPVPDWAPGYTVSAQLRQGDRARIIRATRVTSGAEVVLKVLPLGAGQVELGHLRSLDGVPGVVPLLDAGATTDGAFFVVTPFYPDGSFKEMLSKKGPAPLQEAAAVARSVAGALGALHGRGLLHNDVCPGNILRAGRTPVLTGFGAACAIGEALPPPFPQKESFLHSPPESLRGEPRSAASDVYQLASTIWTMLTGRAPFSATDGSPFDPRIYTRLVLEEEVAPVPRRDVSRSLRRVLTRALAKDPRDRYPSPAEFAAAFERARSGRVATSPNVAQPSTSRTVLGDSPTGPRSAPTGPQVPPTGTGPQAPPAPVVARMSQAPSGPQTPPVAPPPPSPPTAASSGPQASHLPVPSAPHAPPTVSGTGPQRPPGTSAPEAGHPPSGPPQRMAEDRNRLSNASSLRPPQRPLPTPEDRERHGAVPEASPHSTADLMMAKLRGEEVSPLRAWARLEGWSGDAESAHLPTDELTEERSPGPEWDSLSTAQNPPRWRKQMHIAVTVCGILLATVVASAFAATGSPEPVVAASANEGAEEQEEAEEAPPSPVSEPSPLPEAAPPSEVRLEDTLSAVTLIWADHTGGTGSYFVLGGRQGHDPTTLARTGPGAVTAQISTENTLAEYCFTVIAVDGGSAPANEVCTTRAANRAEAERLAEEEAAAEAEEEAEDEASPSPPPASSEDSDE
ncbi:serine/threonine protein kinase [Nocardiopsis terrae]